MPVITEVNEYGHKTTNAWGKWWSLTLQTWHSQQDRLGGLSLHFSLGGRPTARQAFGFVVEYNMNDRSLSVSADTRED